MQSPRSTYLPFQDWNEVLEYARETGLAYYKAPLNPQPVKVQARVEGDSIHIQPPLGSETDPFLADRAHLPRFHYLLVDPVRANLHELFGYRQHLLREREEDLVEELSETLRTKHASELVDRIRSSLETSYWAVNLEGTLELLYFLGIQDTLEGLTERGLGGLTLLTWASRILDLAAERLTEKEAEEAEDDMQ